MLQHNLSRTLALNRGRHHYQTPISATAVAAGAGQQVAGVASGKQEEGAAKWHPRRQQPPADHREKLELLAGAGDRAGGLAPSVVQPRLAGTVRAGSLGFLGRSADDCCRQGFLWAAPSPWVPEVAARCPAPAAAAAADNGAGAAGCSTLTLAILLPLQPIIPSLRQIMKPYT